MWLKSSNAQLVSSMKLNSQLVAFLTLVCVSLVRESHSAFVPGRCLCPKVQKGVRGELKELLVLPKSATCSNVTVIVTLKNDAGVCLDPEALMAKQLIRCWNRAHKLDRDVKLCLKRRRMRGGQRQRQRQRRRGQIKNASSSVPQ
ncbi:C-X-C motif chemokine 9-like [Melanotaenia boesemani]|uniref:C-X-C motif chemokine 9-like n=1 Tax=Melanotaenia boesemani TaxID=1250792 RepID=UPI001C053F9D|nr:C-X-C motif chemokine 9-like [Melanotaenia boesemani]